MHSFSPTKLGRYEIQDEIGKGAMGVVYLARDPLIGRLVALKTFRVGLSVKDAELEQFRARFIREAQSAGILSHPNIVTIHDVVEASEEGIAFIAMEYVQGTNLKLVLQDGRPLSLGFVAEIISQVAGALDYAHSCRVVHRDVKPANILITGAIPDEPRVKITDFGIARLDTSNLTQEGQLLGTPNYMSPEQILGREVDHRADIFSLGVVLYEMLTRHKPFQGENLTVVSHRIVYDVFTPLREYIRELPAEIERILVKALEKDPARRFQRAREMGEELRRAIGGGSASELLNETQSLSSTLLLPTNLPLLGEGTGSSVPSSRPLPPPRADDATAVRPASWPAPPPPPPPAGGTVPPLPVAAPAAAPAAPAAPAIAAKAAPKKGGAGLALAAGAAVLVLAAAGGGLWFWRSHAAGPTTSPSQTAATDPVPAANLQVEALQRQGQQKLASGDLAGAADAFRQAQRLAPGNREIAAVLAETERALAQPGQPAPLAAKLAEARAALDSRRFEQAEAVAAAALQLAPNDPEGLRILTAARTGRAQQQRERQAQLAARTSSKAPEPGTAPPEPAPVAPVAPEPAPQPDPRPATLMVYFSSQMPEGTVLVYINEKAYLRQPFRYYEGGPFRSRPTNGSFQQRIEVPVGSYEVRVIVTPTGQKARSQGLAGNFPAGVSRSLEIDLGSDGQMRASLR